MLKLSEFRHNHHPSDGRMLAKFVRRGISVLCFFLSSCHPAPFAFTPDSVTQSVEIFTRTPFQLQLPNMTSSPETGLRTPTPWLVPLDTEPYQHPDGLFELSYPASWSFIQDELVVSFTNPSELISAKIHLISTILPISQDAINQLIEAREANTFGIYDGYLQTAKNIENSQGPYIFKKKLYLEGSPKIVISAYWPFKRVVLVLDIWSDQDKIEDAETIFNTFVKSIKFDERAITDKANQLPIIYIKHGNDFLSFDVPQIWTFKRTMSDVSEVNTFTSPDGYIIVQTINYNDGSPISKSVAGDFVLTLLRDIYTNELSVKSDMILPDGREQLIWDSKSFNYEGMTTFEIRNSVLLVFTIMNDKDNRDKYRPILDHILSSYKSNP